MQDNENPYKAPQQENVSKAERAPSTFVVILIHLVAIAVMFIGHVLIRNLPRDERPMVFMLLAVVYFVWPMLCAIVPKQYVLLIFFIPFFGIVQGLIYTGDMGSDTYMFEAQPPCCAGFWALLVGGGISLRRLSKPQ